MNTAKFLVQLKTRKCEKLTTHYLEKRRVLCQKNSMAAHSDAIFANDIHICELLVEIQGPDFSGKVHKTFQKSWKVGRINTPNNILTAAPKIYTLDQLN